jgi:ABA DEFICIENT 4-like
MNLIFEIETDLFILGWLLLVVGAVFHADNVWRKRLTWVGGRLVPIILLLSFAYGFFALRGQGPDGDLTTFAGTLAVFTFPERFLTIWIEFLAYALFAGFWIIENAEKHEISRIAITFCLLLTFLSGGLGILSYLVVLGGVWLYRRRLAT